MSKIEVVWFKDLDFWSVKNFTHSLRSNFPLVELRTLIIENTNKVKPFMFPNENFDILGVNNKEGIYFNETLLGSRIKQSYYQVNGGDIFYNPYRINVGSIGIVPQKFHLKYTSPAYVVFRTNGDVLLAEYLIFVLKSDWFNDYLRSNTKGSVRQNLSFNELNNLKIPLPPLEIQREIVEKIKNIQDKIKALQDEEKRLQEEIEAYIYITLGLERKQEKQKQKVFVVEFKNLDRWDVKHNQDDVGNSNKVSFESIENIVRYMQRGKTPKYSNIKQYPVIAQKCIQWNGIEMQKSLFIDPDSIKNYTQDRFLQDDDILLNSTGIGTLGRVALYKSTINPYAAAVADGHVTVLRFDKDKILPNYFYCYFSSSMIQDSIEEYATGSTKQKELSLSLVKQIQIPLPPLEIQKQIVEYIESKQKIIEENKHKIKTLQSSVDRELQELILA